MKLKQYVMEFTNKLDMGEPKQEIIFTPRSWSSDGDMEPNWPASKEINIPINTKIDELINGQAISVSYDESQRKFFYSSETVAIYVCRRIDSRMWDVMDLIQNKRIKNPPLTKNDAELFRRNLMDYGFSKEFWDAMIAVIGLLTDTTILNDVDRKNHIRNAMVLLASKRQSHRR